MADKILQLVSLDVPYPPDYGAMIDVFFRIKNLNALGIKIILHCFEYGREKQEKLNEICEDVYYYPRKNALLAAFSREPFIVNSRRNKALFDKLFNFEYPVLLEGTHCCACLTDERFKAIKFYVRMHNIEEDYYRHLAKATQFGIRKWIYWMESRKLRNFEPFIERAECLLSVSEKDHRELSLNYKNVKYLPPFIYNDEVSCKTGRGGYALYHGNLNVEENVKAVLFLTDKVFNTINIPLIIAGKNALNIQSKIPPGSQIKIINSPSGRELSELIQNAQINILPTFQTTGIKHKLVNALFAGRHCIVNPSMVEGSVLQQLCHIGNSAEAIKELIISLFKQDFTQEDIERRKKILEPIYSNKKNAEYLASLIFP